MQITYCGKRFQLLEEQEIKKRFTRDNNSDNSKSIYVGNSIGNDNQNLLSTI
jgi:hypothetical protein